MPEQSTPGPVPEGRDAVHARRWWILAVLGVAQLMVVLDISVVNIALPSAQRALHFSNNSREWVVLDRNRGGSFLALAIVGLGLFGVFLFATYYLQQTQHYSPTRTGIAFLPVSVVVVIAAGLANSVLLPRTGPRPLIASGLALSALAMGLMAQLGVRFSYASDLLPALVVLGVGIGVVYATTTDVATRGVDPGDAGVASGLVNATNQVGGSLGLALLSTFAAIATTHYLAGKHVDPSVVAHAAVHGYTTGFWWAGGFFAAGALLTGLLLHGRAPQLVQQADSEAELQPAGAQ